MPWKESEELLALHPPELAIEAELLGGDELLDGAGPPLDPLEPPGESAGIHCRTRRFPWLAARDRRRPRVASDPVRRAGAGPPPRLRESYAASM